MINHIITNLFDKYILFEKKLQIENSLLKNSWVMFNQDSSIKVAFVFLENNKLVISSNGLVEKGKHRWELLNENTFLITIKNETYIYKKFFLDAFFMVLQQDNSNKKIILFNESKQPNRVIYSLKEIEQSLFEIYEKPKILQLESQKNRKQQETKDRQVIFIALILCFFVALYIITPSIMKNHWDEYYIAIDPKGYQNFNNAMKFYYPLGGVCMLIILFLLFELKLKRKR